MILILSHNGSIQELADETNKLSDTAQFLEQQCLPLYYAETPKEMSHINANHNMNQKAAYLNVRFRVSYLLYCIIRSVTNVVPYNFILIHLKKRNVFSHSPSLTHPLSLTNAHTHEHARTRTLMNNLSTHAHTLFLPNTFPLAHTHTVSH